MYSYNNELQTVRKIKFLTWFCLRDCINFVRGQTLPAFIISVEKYLIKEPELTQVYIEPKHEFDIRLI